MRIVKVSVPTGVVLGLLSAVCLCFPEPACGDTSPPAPSAAPVVPWHGRPGVEGAETWRVFEEYWFGHAPRVQPIENAPAIMCGTVTAERVEEESEGPALGRQMKGRWHVVGVSVDDAIKGMDRDTKSVEVRFFAPSEYPPLSLGSLPYSLLINVRYLLFLGPTGDPDQYYLLQSSEYMPPPLPLAPTPPEQQEGASVRDRLIVELITTAQQEAVEVAAPAIPVLGFVGSGDQRAVQVLIELAGKDQPDLAVPAMRSLTFGPAKDQDLLPLLEELTKKDDVSISGSAIAARLRLGDKAALYEAVNWSQGANLPQYQVEEISGLIGSNSSEERLKKGDEVVEWGLLLLLDSDGPRFRQSATDALARIATKDLIPTFIKLLDDPDLYVQVLATRGLYEAAEGWHNILVKGYAPASDIFLEDPQRYVAQWKRWWEEGAKIELAPGAVPTIRVEVVAPGQE